MDILSARGTASVAQVLEALPDPPGYSAVRALLRLLEAKGHVRHGVRGRRFIYLPMVPRHEVRQAALLNLLRTYFGGSILEALACLLESDDQSPSAEELDRLAQRIEQARKAILPSR
jgi:predicted transcriptional regulator